MPTESRAGVYLAPGARITWECTFEPNNPVLPAAVPLAKPLPLTPGLAGVSLGVANVRTSIKASGSDAAYALLFEVTNLSGTGGPNFHKVVVGIAH